MKLGEALSLLKKEKARLSRLVNLRKENFYIETKKKPPFDIRDLTKQINEKTEEIKQLKLKIQKTNLGIRLIDGDITVAEAILKISDLRARISDMGNLFERKRDYLFREKNDVDKHPLIEEKKIEEEIEKLQVEKTNLDNKIQITNWTAELLI